MAKNLITEFNHGRLKDETVSENNIVYFRRGYEEMSLNITNRCPNACPFCIRDHSIGWGVSNLYLGDEPSPESIVLAAEDALERVLAVSNALPRNVKICGYGEPILRLVELPLIVSGVNRKYGPLNWQLTTTGWSLFLLPENGGSAMKDLYVSGLRHIYLSLHATDKQGYSKMLRPMALKESAFDMACEFALLCRSIGYDVTLAFINVKRRASQEYVDNIVQLARKLGCGYHIRKYE